MRPKRSAASIAASRSDILSRYRRARALPSSVFHSLISFYFSTFGGRNQWFDRSGIQRLAGSAFRSKRGGYEELAVFLAAFPPRGVVVFGEAQEEIAEHLARAAVPHRVVADLEAAVTAGLSYARPGDVLLLSPACSSFDAFRSYEERGLAFNRIVQRLPGFAMPDGVDK